MHIALGTRSIVSIPAVYGAVRSESCVRVMDPELNRVYTSGGLAKVNHLCLHTANTRSINYHIRNIRKPSSANDGITGKITFQ